MRRVLASLFSSKRGSPGHQRRNEDVSNLSPDDIADIKKEFVAVAAEKDSAARERSEQRRASECPDGQSGIEMAAASVKGMTSGGSAVDAESLPDLIVDFGPGDTVVVKVKVKEGDRERLQSFEGVVIAIRHRGINSAFTVRKISHSEGVERVFQTYSPVIDSIEVKRRGDVCRAKLYMAQEPDQQLKLHEALWMSVSLPKLIAMAKESSQQPAAAGATSPPDDVPLIEAAVDTAGSTAKPAVTARAAWAERDSSASSARSERASVKAASAPPPTPSNS